jgi:hypothetical protein
MRKKDVLPGLLVGYEENGWAIKPKLMPALAIGPLWVSTRLKEKRVYHHRTDVGNYAEFLLLAATGEMVKDIAHWAVLETTANDPVTDEHRRVAFALGERIENGEEVDLPREPAPEGWVWKTLSARKVVGAYQPAAIKRAEESLAARAAAQEKRDRQLEALRRYEAIERVAEEVGVRLGRLMYSDSPEPMIQLTLADLEALVVRKAAGEVIT